MQGIIIEYTALHDRKVTNLQLYDVYTVLVIVVSYDGMSIYMLCYASHHIHMAIASLVPCPRSLARQHVAKHQNNEKDLAS